MWKIFCLEPKLLWVFFLITVVLFSLRTGVPLVIQDVLNALADNKLVSLASAVLLLGGIGGLRMAGWISKFVVETRFRTKLESRLTYNLFKNHSASTSIGIPETINRLNYDTVGISDHITMLVNLTGNAVFSSISLIIMAGINYKLTILMMAPLLIMILVVFVFRDRLRASRELTRSLDEKVSSFGMTSISNILSIKSFGLASLYTGKFKRLNDSRLTYLLREKLIDLCLDSSWFVLYVLMVTAILAGYQMQLFSDKINIGDFALFVNYAFSIRFFIMAIAQAISSSGKFNISIKRLEEFHELTGTSPLFNNGTGSAFKNRHTCSTHLIIDKLSDSGAEWPKD